jgi:murein endopeptidase
LVATGSGYVLEERGSTNGTWLNNRRLVAPTEVRVGDRIYVGSYLVELTPTAPVSDRSAPILIDAPSGPLLRGPSPHTPWRELQGRLQRFAVQWDRERRPPRLCLRDDELSEARRWLDRTPAELAREITGLQREFIAASQRVQGRRLVLRIALGATGVLALTAGVSAAVWFGWSPVADEDDPGGTTEADVAPVEDDGLHAVPIDPPPPPSDADAIAGDVNEPIEHHVVPFETLGEIAQRYGVTTEELAQWNLLNPDEPAIEGKTLAIKRPTRRPLPQQEITYEVDAGETWTALSRRFDVPVTRLRAYNRDVERLDAGLSIKVWIDPKPYSPRLPRKPIPEYVVDRRAISVGSPNAGKLVDGIQMPESKLYTRRKPYIMWGSSWTIANLQKGIATFRQDVDFDGVVIVADISQKGGGLFPPHKSHQAGRDVDIWLPTIKGVYKRKHLGEGKSRPRKPHFEEVDWYATWGLVRGLIKTDAVHYIFLDWDYQKYVYRAAVNMGATEEELDAWIQWPRSKASSKGVFRHSEAHTSHVHVRFACAPWETECKNRTVVEE